MSCLANEKPKELSEVCRFLDHSHHFVVNPDKVIWIILVLYIVLYSRSNRKVAVN